MKDYFFELPDGYVEDRVIDAKNKKMGIIMNVLAVLIMIAVYVALFFILGERALPVVFDEDCSPLETVAPLLLFLIMILPYTVLHELVHGVAYKITTRQKVTFGISWSVAFCGVPNIFVGKKTALIALLSPFILFTAMFATGIAVAEVGYGGAFAWMLALHCGGCVGDLYCTILLLFVYKNGCLIKDTGPKQTFYIKNGEKSNA